MLLSGYAPRMDRNGNTTIGAATDRAGALRLGMVITGLHIDDVWTACIAIDGSLSLAMLKGGLAGTYVLDDHQYDVVAQVLNDRLIEMDLEHLVPYAGDI